MAFIFEKGATAKTDVSAQITPDIYKAAAKDGLTAAQQLNRMFPNADPAYGTAAQQIFASEGLDIDTKNPFGTRPATMAELLDGGYSAAGNTRDNASPFGVASRILVPAAIIEMVEATLTPDYLTPGLLFNQMVAKEISIPTENFEQLVLNMDTKGGPNATRAQRVAQFAEAPTIARFATADRVRRIGTEGFTIEFSSQALRAATLDVVALMLQRQIAVTAKQRAYDQLSAVFVGDSDWNVGAIPSATTTSYDAAASGGVVTHKAWVKFLANNMEYRTITHVAGDINAYLAVESRTGRPGTTNYDPTLSRIDPQAVAIPASATFGGNVQWWITPTGGAVPANTVYALDASSAIARVTNAAAEYTATEAFVLRRSQAMTMQWGQDVFRLMGDAELRPFDVLTIA